MGKRKKPNAKKPFSPSKGGDGGVIPKVVVKFGSNPNISRNANSRRAMTCVERDDWDTLVPTNDPYDRAHGVRDGANMLVPAGKTARGVDKPVKALDAKPRLYPECYMTNAGFSFETAEEKLDERRRAMDGFAPREIVNIPTVKAHVERALAELESRLDAGKSSSSLDRNAASQALRKLRKCIYSDDDRTDEERAADRMADEWAAARGVNLSPGTGGAVGD